METHLRTRREYAGVLQRDLIEKLEKATNKYKNCEEAAEFHYRRCLADRFLEEECRDYVYGGLMKFCHSEDKNKRPICQNLQTSTTGTSSTTQTSTTTKPQILKKLVRTSNIITVGAIAGILLLFAIGLLIYCSIRRRRQRKEEEAEGAWGIPGWSGTTTSENSKEETSKESSKETTWGFGGTTSVETAKDKTSMKAAESKKSEKTKSGPSAEVMGSSNPTPAAPGAPQPPKSAPGPAPPPPPSPGFFKRLGGSHPAPPTAPVVPQPKFDGFFESPQEPLPPVPAPVTQGPVPQRPVTHGPASKSSDQPTGNTAERRPLVWNKQAAENVYY
ncbi:hypothetical protein B9Z55_003716 [Caenorhabditis nigoni]|uniref:Epidermal growth factor receptor-like transmembrane-juxtamembrane segment domain-containing protein n=1 Tax=Caenorhabditis nigoni TaxID=1611254 RepID=A0A2G5VS29_9PELO|nr:hypothetical protein B9Z55_003716 [Caenorhabditis nigoni]